MIGKQTIKAIGLYTSTNDLTAPEGALRVAKNINISNSNLITPMKGFLKTAGTFDSASDRADKIFHYQDKLFAHLGTYQSADELFYYDSGWNSVGSYSAPSDNRMRVLQSNSNLYFTTSAGIKKLDAFDAGPIAAGTPKGLTIEGSLVTGSTVLDNNKAVAYRLVWGLKDANNNLVLGAPSQRLIVINTTGSTKNVDIEVTIPENITTSHIYQLYRTASVANTVTPNDEMQLVYEGNPSSGEITAKTLTISDITPESLRGATLYTSSSQQGIAFANEQPPLAKDMAKFRDVTFYANTTSKHRVNLTIISASSMANDDTITIDSIVYTAKASETVASGYFALATSGTEAQNIEDTALSLCKVINQYSSSTVYAYYLSGSDDLPGKILLEERSLGGSSFDVTSSNYTPLSISTTETSSNDQFKNGLMWSKPFEPEAAPLVNQTRIGSAEAEILRIIPLQEALIIFKEDGIFRLTGFYPNFDIELMDSSALLIGNETPSILNNQIFCLTTQGICAITSEAKIVSTPIEDELFGILDTNLANVKTMAFGQGYESDRTYSLFIPEEGDSYPNKAYVYNSFTRAFVNHFLTVSTSTVYNNNIFVAKADSNIILEQANTGTARDFATWAFDTTISSISSNTLTLASGVDNISVGDVFYQSDTAYSVVTAIDAFASTITVNNGGLFSTGAIEVRSAINTEVEWLVETFDRHANNKIVNECHLLFKRSLVGDGTVSFATDLQPSFSEVTASGTDTLGFGLSPFGTTPFGDVLESKPTRVWLPRGRQRGNWLKVKFKHAYSFSDWALQGLTLFGKAGSTKTNR